MKDKINYNLSALMGNDEVTDEDYVTEFGLDPSAANTPMINTLMLDHVEQKNVDYYVTTGMSEADAKRKAQNFRLDTEKQIRNRMAAKGLI